MPTNAATAEIVSFLGAVLLAATTSATARGLCGSEERPLRAFRKFYVDLVGAFTGLSLLSAAGPMTWSTSGVLGNITSLEGGIALMPVAVGLLLVVMLFARHRWGPRGRRADLLANCVTAVLILIAVVALTSRPSAARGLDDAANRAFTSYCSGHSSLLAEVLQMGRSDPAKQKTRRKPDALPSSDPAQEYASQVIDRLRSQYPLSEAAPLPGAASPARLGISHRTKREVKGEFCDAVIMYLAMREIPVPLRATGAP